MCVGSVQVSVNIGFSQTHCHKQKKRNYWSIKASTQAGLCISPEYKTEERKYMYTGTIKCYFSSLVFHWLDLRQQVLEVGLACSCPMKSSGAGAGAKSLSRDNNILRESSWPWPSLSGYNNLHERRGVRTREVWRRNPRRCQGASPLRLKWYLTGGPGRSSSPSASGANDTVRST